MVTCATHRLIDSSFFPKRSVHKATSITCAPPAVIPLKRSLVHVYERCLAYIQVLSVIRNLEVSTSGHGKGAAQS